MIHVQLSDPVVDAGGTPVVSPELLERAARATLEQLNTALDADLTLVLTDDLQLQALNSQFLGIDAPTDVLSFPADEVDPDSSVSYLGDVVLSYPRAQAQAAEAGHTTEAELQLLVVHGVLHLMGFDHAEEEDKAAMWAVQATVLERLGVDIQGEPG